MTSEGSEHVLLAAVVVNAATRTDAHALLLDAMPVPDGLVVEAWWVAEDDRTDGSDNDSAVFVTPGHQRRAFELLRRGDLTPSHNAPRGGPMVPLFLEGLQARDESAEESDQDFLDRVLAGFLKGDLVMDRVKARARLILNICAWCNRDMTDEVCPNAKDICVDCCGED